MKNSLFYLCHLSFLVVLFSCNRQQKTEAVKNETPQQKQAEKDAVEVDPYFSPNQVIESPYGPSSITRNILEDKNGNIWLATWEGILRYDGTTFTNITNQEGLKRFRVFSLFEDSTGNIWFGTVGAGLYRYDGKSFTNFTTKDGLVNDSIGCIMQDSKGILWIGTSRGLSSYNGTMFSNYMIPEGALNNDINTIIEDDSGKLWIGTRGKAHSFFNNTFTELYTKQEERFTNVRTLLKDKEGNIWLGGDDGLLRYDGNSFLDHSRNFTGYIYQDSNEHIWTSSAADGNSHNWVLTKYDNRSLATPFEIKAEQNMFFGITEDSKGNLWLGTLKGAYRYDGKTFTDFKTPQVPMK